VIPLAAGGNGAVSLVLCWHLFGQVRDNKPIGWMTHLTMRHTFPRDHRKDGSDIIAKVSGWYSPGLVHRSTRDAVLQAQPAGRRRDTDDAVRRRRLRNRTAGTICKIRSSITFVFLAQVPRKYMNCLDNAAWAHGSRRTGTTSGAAGGRRLRTTL
jgi:hypothetical protein